MSRFLIVFTNITNITTIILLLLLISKKTNGKFLIRIEDTDEQ